MASLICDKSGNRSIQFVGVGRVRKTIRLGKFKLTRKAAESVKGYVEALNSATIVGTTPDCETSRWLASIDATLYDKLAAVGIAPERGKARAAKANPVTLGPFLDRYIAGRTDVKGTTAKVYGHTRRCLIGYFGANKPMSEVTKGDAANWRLWLADAQELAPNTVRRRCGIARQYFQAAIDHELIGKNPFAGMKGIMVQENRERDYFVSCEEAGKVLDACPDAEWRLIFALSRYGGLRCPSEHLRLVWSDIDWERAE